ncbi:PEP-CTERM sorting domain-containing protein [Massilia sp. CCM 8733]|uniref:PEP-CTERM sorting domain-containing protein n=2 Tax=Massilia mucilaginosa TaxID=2609282 RepID=A0ABX0NSA8_9BURK|nr:PEP-CTERM sorting domain-containing protein [Massilia mucilaginosa]
MSFTLTPHTGMFVRAIADADAASDVARSSLLVHAGIGAYAGASSFFDSLTSSEPLSTSHPLFGYVHSDADGSLGGIEIRGSSAILIAAEPPIPGIPEPSSWALLAAGLGVLAVARRTARRRGARVG